MLTFLVILILLQCIAILVTLRGHHASTHAVEKRSEEEVDTVLDRLVDQAVKNHEAKLTKVVEKMTEETEQALNASMKKIMAECENLFKEKLNTMIGELSTAEEKRLSSIFEETAAQLSQQSQTLVGEVAENSLKHHLTLKDHDTLAKDSLKKILLSTRPNK